MITLSVLIAACASTDPAPHGASSQLAVPTPAKGALHLCPLSALKVVSTSSGVLMGTDAGIVFTLRNIGRSTCRVGGYLPVYSAGRLIPHGANVLNVIDGDLAPGNDAAFAIVNSYIQRQTASMAPCPTVPRQVPAVRLGGVAIGRMAVIENFCNKTFITPVGVAATGISSSNSSSSALKTLTAYLNAAMRGDCATAERFVAISSSHPGDVCINAHQIGLHFDKWQMGPTAPLREDGADEYAVELHLTEAPLAGGADKPGWTTWFLQLRKFPSGWLLVNGGTGP